MWQRLGHSSLLSWGQIVVLSHLRFAAGVGVLAASLLISSAAVAVADPDSSDSAAPGHGGANASRQGSTTASRPVGDVTDTQRNKTQRITSTLGSGPQSGQQPSPGGEKPKDEPGGTHTKDGTKDDSDLGAAVPDPVAGVPNEVARCLIRSRGFRTRSRRCLIRSPGFRTRSRRCLIRSPGFRTRSRQCLIRWRRFLWR